MISTLIRGGFPNPGQRMAPLEARAVNNQVHNGHILALLQGVPRALLGGAQDLESEHMY